MFRIIKNFNWIILSSFLCIFMGIVTFLTFINEGFVPLTDKNLQYLLIIDIFLPESTSSETIDFMKKASKESPVTRNLSQEIDIKISWHNE